jgi:DNA-directed RNA polymerase subunit RPC12/RpoP
MAAHLTSLIAASRPSIGPLRQTLVTKLTRGWCRVVGHHVDNRRFRLDTPARTGRACVCGNDYLDENGSLTHVRHTLSCFLRHHSYVRLAQRDGHHEYVCVRCGHPLLLQASTDGHDDSVVFDRKVHYSCGVFGHRVHVVTDRDGFREYACHCGHTFLKAGNGERHIRHPFICVLSGHRIRFITRRGGYAEYVCRDCGHPFCFAHSDDRTRDALTRPPAVARGEQ